MKISFAVAALLGLVSGINQKSTQKEQGGQKVDVYAEVGRFINSKGEPINLA